MAIFCLGFSRDAIAIQARGNGDVSAARVRRSVEQGVKYLKDKRRNGTWPKHDAIGDVTALAALALLNAGESPDDPEMRKTIAYIVDAMHMGSLSTYSASLKLMVLAMADPQGRRYRREIERIVDWLEEEQLASGGWGYGNNRGGNGDSSNSQFAILALHEATQVGVEVNQKIWKRAQDYWFECYRQGGGFGYNKGQPPRPSMTCAGISSWIIIDENLADFRNLVDGDRAACCRRPSQMEPVEQSVDHLARRFGVRGRKGIDLYYLYALERAGRLSGQRFFGVHDWYRTGAAYIVKEQKGLTGAWRGTGFGEDTSEIATALALLFLSKGKRPVAIGHYQHGDDDDWKNHPKGVHYLTRELETQWKTKLNWQTVRSKEASVDDLLESPVLFLSGTNAMTLNVQQKESLKQYIDNGGFIFAEACDGEGCASAEAFDRSFRELMAELFPESELAAIEPDHPLWSAHFSIPPNPERPLLGLQACCRTSVVYCPANLSAYWNLNRPGLEPFVEKTNRPQLKERVDYCSQLGVNVVAYATGRQLRERGDTPKVDDTQTASVLVNRSLSFAKLKHGGGSDEAPNALKNILRQLDVSGLEINTEKILIEPQLPQLADYPFVFMHGRTGFEFNSDQRAALRAYLESGGFIFADAICSNAPFAKSMREEIFQITGRRLEPISPDHPIWSQQFYGHRIDRVTLRVRDPQVQGGFRASDQPPALEGLETEGRLSVVFSPNDLSCALENVKFSQCDGYTRNDAERIGFNVILYSLRVD